MKLNIRAKLTLQFTLIVTLILIIFSFSIYYFSSTYRESEFYSRLQNKALNTAKLLLDVKEIDHDLLKIIDKKTINALYNEKVVIYNYKNEQIYNSLDEETIHVSTNLLDEIRLKNEIRYHQGEHEVLGLLFIDKHDRFVVIASALDIYGRSKLKNLKLILFIGFFASIGFSIFIGRIYANRALQPMSNVVKQVDKITISSLDLRVNEGNRTDEIAQLAITFNNMLERLESAFEMQKSFVSNASHELRTPLTSITGQIEVSLMKPRSDEEYRTILQSVLEDIKNLNELANGLLYLAKASSDISSIALRKLRIDELLWETSEELLKRKNDYKISVRFKESIDDAKKLTVFGNEHLLKIALINLMDNACKYSDNKSVEIFLSIKNEYFVAQFKDNGIGIDKEDIDNIFQPFFRAKNTINITGNGLGLTLTKKIIEIHNGKIQIESELSQGTSLIIYIPFSSN